MARDEEGPWRLTIRPLPDPPGGDRRPGWADVPPWVRLREALKIMRRRCGLECVDLREEEKS